MKFLTMNKTRILWISLSLIFNTLGCTKYLDLKPDNSFAVPHSLDDLEGLLDNSEVAMNFATTGLGEVASDNYYLSETSWEGMTNEADRFLYLWQPYSPIAGQWTSPYKAILHANTVLEYLPSIEVTSDQVTRAEYLKGSALFHRAFQIFNLLHVFARPYSPNKINEQLGVVLRTQPSLDEKLFRSSVEECYNFIIEGFIEAAALLPQRQDLLTRPSQAAAYAELARVYLVMGEFEKCTLYADSALMLQSALLDYESEIDPNKALPFSKWNKEVLFDVSMNGGIPLAPIRRRVNPLEYGKYEDNDIRKAAFFSIDDKDEILFKGNYNGLNSSLLFCGTTTAEMYLIRAESKIRRNLLQEAAQDINHLRKHRFTQAAYEPLVFANLDHALAFIKEERQREMIFRGQKWPDMKRYILLQEFNGYMERVINGENYRMTADEIIKYVYKLPDIVVDNGDLQQNDE